MRIFEAWILLAVTIRSSKQDCSLRNIYQLTNNEYDFQCSNTNSENLVYDFFHSYRSIEARAKSGSYDLEITNSDFTKIYSIIPPLPPEKFKLRSFVVTNSSVEFIDDWAFENLIHVTDLDLSNNKLQSLSFVSTLPANLVRLYLSGNNFTVVRNVFSHLNRLTYLDLSNCEIYAIENDSFSGFYNEIFINLRNNQLKSFDVVFQDGLKLELDLSYNNIKYIDYRQRRIYFRGLKASHNKVENISDISCQDCGYGYYRRAISFIDLSFNDLHNVTYLNFFSAIKVENLNLSNSNIGGNFNYEILKYVRNTVDLSNNNLKIIKPYMLGYELDLTNLLLYNSSIYDIEANGFGKYKLNVLNVSSNFIKELRNSVFKDSSINILDISRCSIEKIHSETFFGLTLTDTLNLSHNRIIYLNKDMFQYLRDVVKIDLSFNLLKNLDNNLFFNCEKLRILTLSDAKIETIQSMTFFGAVSLSELYLQNNLLGRIEFQTFNVPNLINLQNNAISHLNFHFLRNVSVNSILLSNNHLVELMNNSASLPAFVKEMDLSKSEISDIDINAFQGLNSLEVLDLSDNFLKAVLAGTFVPLKKLKNLDLSRNNLSTFSANAFAFGNQLSKLHITFFETNLPSKTFVTFNQLTDLTVSNSLLTSLEENCFKGLIHVRSINLQNVEITEIQPGAFKGLDSLQNVDVKILFRNTEKLKKGAFENLPNLLDLDLSHLNLSILEENSFNGLPNLLKLLLNGNEIEKIVNNTFLGLDSLKTLNLSNNHIKALEPSAFAGLIRLEELYLSQNNLTKLSLGTFQEFPNLKVMCLRKNFINKLLTGTFSNLKRLDWLDLSHNNITKLKMENFMSLTNLKHLDFTANNLIRMNHLDLIKSLRQLEFIGLNSNKWKCENLATMLTAFQNYSISWMSEKNMTFEHENIDGIKCYDICKFFYCADEQDTKY